MDVKAWRNIMNTGKVLCEAIEPYGGKVTEIDGKSKQSAIKYIHNKFYKSKIGKGFYRDDSWQGIRKVWKLFDSMDIDWDIMDSKYEKEDNIPVRKRWTIEIRFMDNKGKQKKIGGTVVASGAGSVEDPLDRYDILAYFW